MTTHHTRRRLLTTAVPALAAGVLLAASGVLDPVHAALLVVAIAAVAHVWRTLDEGVTPTWPPTPPVRRAGARNDVSELGWATFTRSGAVGDRMTARVRTLAATRLAAHGVSLDAAADHRTPDHATAVRLLGAPVVDGLTSRRQAGHAEVHRWLDALEALAAVPAAPQPRTATPTRTPDPDGRPTA